MGPTVTSKRTRPRNRRDLILRAACSLFGERGYHNVGMDDIGDAVGITGPAVYRHFASKEDLLMAALVQDLERTIAGVAKVDAGLRGIEAVAETVGAVVDTTMQDWDLAVVFRREAPALPAERRAQIEPGRRQLAEMIAGAVQQVHPDLVGDDLRLRLEAQYGMLTGVLIYGSSSHRRRYAPVVKRMGTEALALADVPPLHTRDVARLPAADGVTGSRREIVLTAAMQIFAERGYASAGIDEAGEGARLSGSSVYRHFSSKEALLIEALRRAGAVVKVLLSEVLTLDLAPAAMLDELIARIVDLAHRNPDLLVLLLTSGHHLTPEDRQWHDDDIALLLDEWTGVLLRARPDLSDQEALTRVLCCVGVVARVSAARRLRAYDTRPAMTSILTRVLAAQ